MSNKSEAARARAIEQALVKFVAQVEAISKIAVKGIALKDEVLEMLSEHGRAQRLSRESANAEHNTHFQSIIDDTILTIDGFVRELQKFMKTGDCRIRELEVAATSKYGDDIFTHVLRMAADDIKFHRVEAVRKVKQLEKLVALVKKRARPN